MTSRPVKIMAKRLTKTMVSKGTRHSLATRGSKCAENSQMRLVCITQEHKVHTTSWPIQTYTDTEKEKTSYS